MARTFTSGKSARSAERSYVTPELCSNMCKSPLAVALLSRQRAPSVAMHNGLHRSCVRDVRGIRPLQQVVDSKHETTSHWLHELPHSDDNHDDDEALATGTTMRQETAHDKGMLKQEWKRWSHAKAACVAATFICLTLVSSTWYTYYIVESSLLQGHCSTVAVKTLAIVKSLEITKSPSLTTIASSSSLTTTKTSPGHNKLTNPTFPSNSSPKMTPRTPTTSTPII